MVRYTEDGSHEHHAFHILLSVTITPTQSCNSTPPPLPLGSRSDTLRLRYNLNRGFGVKASPSQMPALSSLSTTSRQGNPSKERLLGFSARCPLVACHHLRFTPWSTCTMTDGLKWKGSCIDSQTWTVSLGFEEIRCMIRCLRSTRRKIQCLFCRLDWEYSKKMITTHNPATRQEVQHIPAVSPQRTGLSRHQCVQTLSPDALEPARRDASP